MAETFAELMARFRRGDATAAAELVAQFGPQIRRAIRVHGTGSRVGRVFDSEDLLQSVLRTFWEERDTPQLRAEGPGQLVSWLLTVARNRRAARARDAAAAKRGGKLADGGADALEAVPTAGPSVLSEAADRELLGRVLARLTPEERFIVNGRANGVEWKTLAEQLGTTAEALRMQHRRAMARVTGLDEDGA